LLKKHYSFRLSLPKQLNFENVSGKSAGNFYYQAIVNQNGAIGIILQSINQLQIIQHRQAYWKNTVHL